MLKKAIAFFSALVLSATAVGALAVTAAEDWHECLHSSSTFTATDYDGLIQLRSSNGKATMLVNTGYFATTWKELEVIPYKYDSSAKKYKEILGTGSAEGCPQSISASIGCSTSEVDYICSLATVFNTKTPQAGTYRTLVSHIKRTDQLPIPDPWITYNN